MCKDGSALKTRVIPKEEIEKQYYYIQQIKDWNDLHFKETGIRRSASVRTFGCQMNAHDSEKLAGMLNRMGYLLCDESVPGDLVIFNTCCVRENAEEKVYGHIGALKGIKREKPDMVTAVCGCMTEQPHVLAEIQKKYRNVDLVFGTRNQHRFPEFLYHCIFDGKRVYELSATEGEVAEGVPILRDSPVKAWVTIMYGCNNFCSYCIVPYVRGRERSRQPADILQEVRKLSEAGVKEITLLGQNVNSYGKDLEAPVSFAALLTRICEETAVRRIRFMTSHPKDLSEELIDVMAKYPALCRQLHLPVQSGSTEILRRMNRHYTKEQYLNLINRIRTKIPDIALSTDIIVGFPGETEQDFAETLDLMRRVRFEMAYTFLYSKRVGTPAAAYEEQVPETVMKERFNRLLEVQNQISYEINTAYIGKCVEVLTEGQSRTNEDKYTGRTESNKIVNFSCPADTAPAPGTFVQVRVEHAQTWSLEGALLVPDIK